MTTAAKTVIRVVPTESTALAACGILRSLADIKATVEPTEIGNQFRIVSEGLVDDIPKLVLCNQLVTAYVMGVVDGLGEKNRKDGKQ